MNAVDLFETRFRIVMRTFGEHKINVIKAVKEELGLGLAEAKQLVEAGGVIQERCSKEEADRLLHTFNAAGADCVIEAE